MLSSLSIVYPLLFSIHAQNAISSILNGEYRLFFRASSSARGEACTLSYSAVGFVDPDDLAAIFRIRQTAISNSHHGFSAAHRDPSKE